jgi:hypothetical protein
LQRIVHDARDGLLIFNQCLSSLASLCASTQAAKMLFHCMSEHLPSLQSLMEDSILPRTPADLPFIVTKTLPARGIVADDQFVDNCRLSVSPKDRQNSSLKDRPKTPAQLIMSSVTSGAHVQLNFL